MSATAYPIPPDLFRTAIETLDLDQLHKESARLLNSIHHLQRSNISLQEFAETDTVCADAIRENNETIHQQEERVFILEEEVKRRGYRMGHADDGQVTNTSTTNNGDGSNRGNGHGHQQEEDGDGPGIHL